tara:strand:- start:958 stop:1134 length:177 start_codon:yes stop_codon:yes gene_type:complete
MGNPKDVKHVSSKTLEHDERIKIKKNNREHALTQKKEKHGSLKRLAINPRLWRSDWRK